MPDDRRTARRSPPASGASLSKVRDAYGRARDTIDGLDTGAGRAAFYDGVRAAVETLNKEYDASALDTGRLNSDGAQAGLRRGPGVSLTPDPAPRPGPAALAVRRRGGRPVAWRPRRAARRAGRGGPDGRHRPGRRCVVDAAWRVHVLVAELAARGAAGELGADRGRPAPGAHRVRHASWPPLRARPGCAARRSGRRPGSTSTAVGCGSGSPRAGAAGPAGGFLLRLGAGRPRRAGAPVRRGARRGRAARRRCSVRRRAGRRTGSPAGGGWPGWPSWSATGRPPRRRPTGPATAWPRALSGRRSCAGAGGSDRGRRDRSAVCPDRPRRLVRRTTCSAEGPSIVTVTRSAPYPRCTVAPSGGSHRACRAGVPPTYEPVCRPRNPKRGRRVTLDIRTAGGGAAECGTARTPGRSRAGVRSGRDVPSNARSHPSGHRRVTGEGQDDLGLPRPGIRRRGQLRPRPRPAAQRRRRAGQVQEASRGPGSASTSTTASHAALRRLRRPQASRSPS